MSSIGRRRPEGGGGSSSAAAAGVSSPFERDPSSSSRHYHHQQQQNRHHHQQQQRSQHQQQQQQDHPPLVVRYQNDNHNNVNNGNYDNTNNQSNNNPAAAAAAAVVESSSRLLSSPVRPRRRNWSDMTRTIYHYERIEQIGEGTYGQVYRARCKDTNEIVALKKIRVHHGIHWGIPPTVIREIKILKRLVHPNLVRMDEVVSSKGVEYLDTDDYHKGSDRNRSSSKNNSTSNKQQQQRSSNKGGQGDDNDDDGKSSSTNKNSQIQITDTSIEDAREAYKGNLFLVLEYVPHDLTGLLDIAYKFTEIEIKCIFQQLLEALAYMHHEKYIHRDIKSSNILIDRNFRLKLADFGLARSIEPPLLDKLHEYVSPQKNLFIFRNSLFYCTIIYT